MEQRKQGRGWNGHFLGFWARLNCENMPVIQAWLVRCNLNDPRKIPYLLVWKDERDGEINLSTQGDRLRLDLRTPLQIDTAANGHRQ